MKWYDAAEAPFKIYGLPFFETEHVYRRLPLNPPAPLPPSVESLCGIPAGGQVRFRARFRSMALRVTMEHAPKMTKTDMPPMGLCGFDCYLNRAGEEPFYIATASPRNREDFLQVYEARVLEMDEPDDYFVTLNMPLYCRLVKLEVGLDDNAAVSEGEPFPPGRIVVYGSSIMHGCSASRPDMLSTNILSRWMNREFINLGFSGNAKAEPEVALAMRRITDVSLIVVEAANSPDAAWLEERLPRFLELLREVYPTVPILVWQIADFARFIVRPKEAAVFAAKREVEEKTVRSRIAAGDRHISIARMSYEDEFMGHDLSREATVDGTHPTNLGFAMMAKKLYPILTSILNEDK